MSFIIDLIKTIILGIVQGITEWLPVSSTGHLILFDSLWPLTPPEFFNVFKVVIQFGSILAVLFLYFKKLNPFDPSKSNKQKKDTFSLWGKVIVGVIPAGIIGLLLDDIIDGYLSANFVIAITLIAYGIIFIIVEKNPKPVTINKLDQLDYLTFSFHHRICPFCQKKTIDDDLVHSQETRRILDRIIGFRLSKLMQSKTGGKSAGRVSCNLYNFYICNFIYLYYYILYSSI